MNTSVNAELEKGKEAPTGRTVEDAKSMKDKQKKKASTGETIHIQGNHHTLNKTPKWLIPQSAKVLCEYSINIKTYQFFYLLFIISTLLTSQGGWVVLHY